MQVPASDASSVSVTDLLHASPGAAAAARRTRDSLSSPASVLTSLRSTHSASRCAFANSPPRQRTSKRGRRCLFAAPFSAKSAVGLHSARVACGAGTGVAVAVRHSRSCSGIAASTRGGSSGGATLLNSSVTKLGAFISDTCSSVPGRNALKSRGSAQTEEAARAERNSSAAPLLSASGSHSTRCNCNWPASWAGSSAEESMRSAMGCTVDLQRASESPAMPVGASEVADKPPVAYGTSASVALPVAAAPLATKRSYSAAAQISERAIVTSAPAPAESGRCKPHLPCTSVAQWDFAAGDSYSTHESSGGCQYSVARVDITSPSIPVDIARSGSAHMSGV